MTLEAFYFIAQIISAIAIVGSLIFVGLQIRANTKEQRFQRAHERAQRVAPAFSDMVNNADLRAAMLKSRAGASREAFTPDELFLLNNHFRRIIESHLITYREMDDGYVDPVVQEPWRKSMYIMFEMPVFREFWVDVFRAQNHPMFQAYMDGIMNAVEPVKVPDDA